MTLFDGPFRRMLFQVVRRARRSRVAVNEDARPLRARAATAGAFSGHRAYAPGEDLRHVDWNAYARSGELHLKSYDEERRRSCALLLDRSASMRAGEPERFDSMRRLAAVVGVMALCRLDALHLWTGDGVRSFVGSAAIEALLTALDAETIREAEDGVAAVRAAVRHDAAGRLVWLSDFADVAELEEGLGLLAARRLDAAGLLPVIDDDRPPRVGGYVQLEDPESGRAMRVAVDADLRREIAAELERRRHHVEGVFRRAGVELIEHPIPAPEDRRAVSWLPLGVESWS